MILSHVSLKSLTNCQVSFTLRGNTQELALGAGSTQRSTYSSLHPHFYGCFKSKMTFVQLSFYQEPKCIGLNQALEYSPLSPPTILFRHPQITTMSSYQKVNIGQYTDIYVSHAKTNWCGGFHLIKTMKSVILMLLGNLSKTTWRIFSVKRGGYPPFPLSFFGHNEFPLRGGEYPPILLRKKFAKEELFLAEKRLF